MKTPRTRSAVVAGLLLSTGPLAAKEISLIAGETTRIMPDGTPIVMWGFAEDTNANRVLDNGETITTPGPLIVIPWDDASGLIVHVYNALPVPVSLVIPGASTSMQPVFFTDAQGRRRVRSFTHETPPAALGTYTWTALGAGSHVYHSGTHPQVQVQMGLYGGIKKDAADGFAYPGVAYGQEAILFFSEIDPSLHAAVAESRYGAGAQMSSTIDYLPRYFLINGAPYEPGVTPPLAIGAAGGAALLRLYNMGLTTRVPLLQQGHLRVVAEDGYPYHYPTLQYAVELAATQTKDALFIPPTEGTYPLFDRRLAEGAIALLDVAAATPEPTALNDAYAMDEDTALSVSPPGVLINDGPAGVTLSALLVDPVTTGTLALAADGSFTYTPPPQFNGTTWFTYRVSDGITQSAPATVTLTVRPLNDAPVAQPDAYTAIQGTALTIGPAGVLSNDTDIDGDPLTATLVTPPANGSVTLNPDGGFTYLPTAAYVGNDSFTYAASDGTANSEAIVTLTIAEAANSPPVANDDNASTFYGTAVTIGVTDNDTDDGTLDPGSVTVVTMPLHGSAVSNGDGSITYTPDRGYLGTDAFGYTVRDDQGALSNEATVRVNVTRTR